MRSTGLPEAGSNHSVKPAGPEPSKGKERGAPVERRMVEGKEGDVEIKSEDNCSNVDKRWVLRKEA